MQFYNDKPRSCCLFYVFNYSIFTHSVSVTLQSGTPTDQLCHIEVVQFPWWVWAFIPCLCSSASHFLRLRTITYCCEWDKRCVTEAWPPYQQLCFHKSTCAVCGIDLSDKANENSENSRVLVAMLKQWLVMACSVCQMLSSSPSFSVNGMCNKCSLFAVWRSLTNFNCGPAGKANH